MSPGSRMGDFQCSLVWEVNLVLSHETGPTGPLIEVQHLMAVIVGLPRDRARFTRHFSIGVDGVLLAAADPVEVDAVA